MTDNQLMIGALPTKLMIGVSSVAFFLQAVAVDPGSFLAQAEHVTLTGALIIAVSILWRSNQKKDDLIVETTKVTTAALGTTTASNVELRKTIEGLRDVIEGSEDHHRKLSGVQ